MTNIVVKKQASDTQDMVQVTSSGNPAGVINVTTSLVGTNLNDLGDVDIAGLVDRSLLLWDSATSKYKAHAWDNMTIDGGQII
jgi:hypothetical protein